jgi:hypothetical protein
MKRRALSMPNLNVNVNLNLAQVLNAILFVALYSYCTQLGSYSKMNTKYVRLHVHVIDTNTYVYT